MGPDDIDYTGENDSDEIHCHKCFIPGTMVLKDKNLLFRCEDEKFDDIEIGEKWYKKMKQTEIFLFRKLICQGCGI